jgi:hypothetical protein
MLLRKLWRQIRSLRGEQAKANRDTRRDLQGLKEQGGDGGGALLGMLAGLLPSVVTRVMSAAIPALIVAAARFIPTIGGAALVAGALKLAKDYFEQRVADRVSSGEYVPLTRNSGLADLYKRHRKAGGATAAQLNEAGKSAGYGNTDLMERVIRAESGGNPAAVPLGADGKPMPGQTAFGLGQITKPTWLGAMRKFAGKYGVDKDASEAELMVLREDPKMHLSIMAELMKESERVAQKAGRNDNASVYAGYTLGASEGGKFLSALNADPNTPTSAVLSKATINANESLYRGKTVGQTYRTFQNKVGGRAVQGSVVAEAPVIPTVPSLPRIPTPAAVVAPGAAPQVDTSSASRVSTPPPPPPVVMAPSATSQDVRDRTIAHIATGGIGAARPYR